MRSDYIPRLRAELVSAAERRQSRRRRLAPRGLRPLRPLVAVAAMALVAVAVVVAVDRRDDELPADSVRFGYRVDGGAAAQAEDIMRERLATAGVRGGTVSTGPDGRLIVSAPPESRAEVDALTQPGRLAIYDWEASVLGPDGAPAPGDPSVTGGEDAGNAGATSLPQAEVRAAAARGGGRVVRTLAGVPERWYALGGDPALTNEDIASADVIVDGLTGEPAVALEFTPEGRTAFSSLTREIAQRGADERAWQHFAMVLDDRIAAIPFIDYRQNPDGIDGSSGAQIAGGLSPDDARRLAAILDSGPLPGELDPVMR
jgi:preprotein translocase subunit SecD